MSLLISVIIPSLNSPLIAEVVDAVRAQEGVAAPPEIVIVGRDEPDLVPLVEGVHFIDTEEAVFASVARNLGIRASTGDLLIFLDSDCIPLPGWLASHVAAHEAGYRVVSGSVVPTGKNYWQLTYNLTLFHEILESNPPGPRDFLATLNLSIERSVLETAGMMNEQINRVEDVDWTTRMRRAGIVPYFWPEAAVCHKHNRTTFNQVWQDCALSGYHMRTLRLKHNDMLQAPRILRYPTLVLILSPLIALAATGRILLRRPSILYRFWQTIPALYLTKIAWCWGASRPAPRR